MSPLLFIRMEKIYSKSNTFYAKDTTFGYWVIRFKQIRNESRSVVALNKEDVDIHTDGLSYEELEELVEFIGTVKAKLYE